MASKDLLVVGAYPPAGKYEEYHATKDDRTRALTQIAKVPIPDRDPVYGKDGPLARLWHRAPRKRLLATQ
jgi:uncharacterized protein YjlB